MEEQFHNLEEPHSLHSRRKIPIRVENFTNHNVDIIWINFAGEYVKYAMIASRGFLDVDTFETHPWIAIHSETKDRVLINHQFIYMPKNWREQYQGRIPNHIMNTIPEHIVPRISIPVTLPLYSLRYKTLLKVASYMKYESDVDALDLPLRLKDDLRRLINYRERFPLNDR